MTAARPFFLIVGLILLAGAPPQANAASFDCARAAAHMEHIVCDDPKLSALDDELGKTYGEALALSLDPAEFRIEQREWLARMQQTATAQELQQFYGVRLDVLRRTLATERAAEREVTEHDARAGCLAGVADIADGESCKLDKFANLGAVAGHDLVYAAYLHTPLSGTANDAIVLAAQVVVFERAGGKLHVLFAPKNDGARFEAPKLLHTRAGDLLHIPGWENGTGNFNRERLFAWRGDHWRDIDTNAWLITLQKQLPKGLGAWKGIYPDYTTMTARTPLWRETDGNCCPTSGKDAVITLTWAGDRIALAAVHLEHAKPD